MRRFVIGSLVVMLVATGCTHKPKRATSVSAPSVSATASPTTTPALAGKRARKVIVQHDRSITLYDVAADTSRVIGSADFGTHPRFETEHLVTWISFADVSRMAQLVEFDTTGGSSKVLFEATSIRGYEWSPARSVVAFIGLDGDTTSLYLWRRTTGKVELVRHLGTIAGRDGEDADDIGVRWEADGERLGVVDTPLDSTSDGPKSTMYVIRQAKDVVAPRNGAHLIWLDTEHVAYMRWGEPNDWRTLDVATGVEKPLALARGGIRPSLAPDLSGIAYDLGPTDQSVHVFSLRAMTDRRIADDGVGALWMDPSHIAVTDVEKCVPVGDCGPDPWRERGGSSLLGLDGSRRPLHLPATLDADVWF